MCVALFVLFVSVCQLVERSGFSVNLIEFPESVHVRVGNHLPYFIIIFIAHLYRSYLPPTDLKLFLIQIHCIIRSVLYYVYFKSLLPAIVCPLKTMLTLSFSLLITPVLKFIKRIKISDSLRLLILETYSFLNVTWPTLYII